MIKYLKKINDQRIKVYFLNKNYGHKVLWESHLFDEIISKQYYVLTDPDIFRIESCPDDYVEQFYKILQKNPSKTKVGFALKIDDLPEEYPFKYDIIRLESFYWEKKVPYDFTIYDAPIDTTFALYRPGKFQENKFYEGIRTGTPYIARHNGWYLGTSKNENNFQYYDAQNKFSTSNNRKAMENSQLDVIRQLLLRQEKPFFEITRYVISNDKLKCKISYVDILISSLFLLAKKTFLLLGLKK